MLQYHFKKSFLLSGFSYIEQILPQYKNVIEKSMYLYKNHQLLSQIKLRT